MEKRLIDWEFFSKAIPLLTLLVIAFGYFDLITYYNRFGIRISNFLDATEIILASINNLLVSVLAAIFIFLIWVSYFDYLFIKEVPFRGRRPQLFGSEPIRKFLIKKEFLVFFLVLGVSSILIVILRRLYNESEILFKLSVFSQSCYLTFIFAFLIGIPLTEAILKSQGNQVSFDTKVSLALIIFVPTMFLSIIMKNNTLFNQIRKHGNFQKIALILDNNQKIIPTDTLRFIGNTKGFYFYWNKVSKHTLIYPAGKVDVIINDSTFQYSNIQDANIAQPDTLSNVLISKEDTDVAVNVRISKKDTNVAIKSNVDTHLKGSLDTGLNTKVGDTSLKKSKLKKHS